MSPTDIGQGAAIFGLEGPKLTARERDFFRAYDPFGFILFARNVENPEQLRRLTGDLRAAVGRDAVIMIDQEGGRVQRLRAPHWRDWAPALETVQAFADPAQAAEAMFWRFQLIGAELAAVGIDANCAPVCDVADDLTHVFLKNRCYGTDPAQVAQIARAVADGLLSAGVLPVVKHIPGHGRARADSHLSLPRVDAPEASLRQSDFAPFKALADLPMAMSAHIVYEAFDPETPATQSPKMIDLIREEIGFGGLLMTDDLNMEALAGDLRERTRASIAAGCDLALHCKGDFWQMQEVAEAAGEMGAQGRARAAATHLARRKGAAPDLAAARAALAALGGPALGVFQ